MVEAGWCPGGRAGGWGVRDGPGGAECEGDVPAPMDADGVTEAAAMP